ncbi:unnamed protein product [Mytilus coruscus]|uniref:Zinc finger PHD-type domain-containing protein n=1 Tax=Mytilus coruscus TaxID=42192 RepID=A0A6J8D940_MYTCO|nr:unnamed protein product [Mytilus coruscus]
MAIDEISTCSREGEEFTDSKIQNDQILAIEVNLENSKTEESRECQGCERPLTNTSPTECSACKFRFHTRMAEYHMTNYIYDSYMCSYCRALELTIPYEDRPYQGETLPKQIVNSTSNKLDGVEANRFAPQHILQEDKVPTAPQNSRNNHRNTSKSDQRNMALPNDDAKTKPRRAKKRDMKQTIMELQLSESKAKISTLVELNKEYRTTIDMLSVKLGIPSPVGYNNTHPPYQMLLPVARKKMKELGADPVDIRPLSIQLGKESDKENLGK